MNGPLRRAFLLPEINLDTGEMLYIMTTLHEKETNDDNDE